METRSRLRQSVAFPVIFASDTTINEGIIVNLAPNGCAIQTWYAARRGEYLKLRLLLPDQSLALAVDVAKVRWRRYGVLGVEFLRIRREEQYRLRQFLARSLLRTSLQGISSTLPR
jgi:hypothetical protein